MVSDLPGNPPVKEFWKSVKIWHSYGQDYGSSLFLTHSVNCAICCRTELALLADSLTALHNWWFCYNDLALTSINLYPSYFKLVRVFVSFHPSLTFATGGWRISFIIINAASDPPYIHGCALSAIVRFRWPNIAFGTVCHPSSPQLQRSLFFSDLSQNSSKLISVPDHSPHNC